jgi:hypothetical protein
MVRVCSLGLVVTLKVAFTPPMVSVVSVFVKKLPDDVWRTLTFSLRLAVAGVSVE